MLALILMCIVTFNYGFEINSNSCVKFEFEKTYTSPRTISYNMNDSIITIDFNLINYCNYPVTLNNFHVTLENVKIGGKVYEGKIHFTQETGPELLMSNTVFSERGNFVFTASTSGCVNEWCQSKLKPGESIEIKGKLKTDQSISVLTLDGIALGNSIIEKSSGVLFVVNIANVPEEFNQNLTAEILDGQENPIGEVQFSKQTNYASTVRLTSSYKYIIRLPGIGNPSTRHYWKPINTVINGSFTEAVTLYYEKYDSFTLPAYEVSINLMSLPNNLDTLKLNFISVFNKYVYVPVEIERWGNLLTFVINDDVKILPDVSTDYQFKISPSQIDYTVEDVNIEIQRHLH